MHATPRSAARNKYDADHTLRAVGSLTCIPDTLCNGGHYSRAGVMQWRFRLSKPYEIMADWLECSELMAHHSHAIGLQHRCMPASRRAHTHRHSQAVLRL